MRLKTISIRGFRPFLDEVTIPIDDLTVFIGRNDVGKSSILEAIGVFLGTVKIEPQDCNVYSQDKIIEITCEFDQIPQSIVLDATAQTTLEKEYLLTSRKTLKIKKRWDCSGSRPKEEVFICAYHPTLKGYNDLLTLTNSQLKTRLREIGISEEGVDLRSNPAIRQAIWRSCPDLKLQEIDIPVNASDAKSIWEQVSKLLPFYALFKSDRPSQDSDSEVQDPMKLAIQTALAEVRADLDRISEIVKEKALEIARRTHEQLRKFDDKLASELHPEFKQDPQWDKAFSICMQTEDGIPLNKRGSGIRRLVLISFFRAEAERRRVEHPERSIIYAIEEPETSQHPNNQKLLLSALEELSQEDGCQVLLTTHSPGLANLVPLNSLRYVEQVNRGQIRVRQGDDQVFQDIIASLGIVPDQRVKILICVEGPTDVKALKHMSHILHTTYDSSLPDLSTDSRVAFVVLGGGTLEHWVNEHYLRPLGLPEVHIYDSDSQYQGACMTVNSRGDGSWAVQLSKKEIENYLHPDAIHRTLGISVSFGDTDDVPSLVQSALAKQGRRFKESRIKKMLADLAFPAMTAQQIRNRDPNGEIESILRRISTML